MLLKCWRNPREIWTQDLVQMDEDQSLVLQPNSSYIISSCLLIFPLSWSLQRSAGPLGCCVCSLLTAACRTSQSTSPLAASCDVQYTVTTVIWKNAPGRWYGLMLMATSSSSLLRSCSQIVMCPMFHHLLLRNTASLTGFSLNTLLCCVIWKPFYLVITSRVTIVNHDSTNSRLPLMSTLHAPQFIYFFFGEEDHMGPMKTDENDQSGICPPRRALCPGMSLPWSSPELAWSASSWCLL